MIAIYAGDATDVVKRICSNHCSGNVEGSALRRHIAEKIGYKIKSTRRSSGTYRVRLDLPNPKTGEQLISAYVRTGLWKFNICDTYEEAQDFQWYVIDKLKPLLNVRHDTWNPENIVRYQLLMSELTASPGMTYMRLKNIVSGPGVYVLFHEKAL
jgi:hypothetical protein